MIKTCKKCGLEKEHGATQRWCKDCFKSYRNKDYGTIQGYKECAGACKKLKKTGTDGFCKKCRLVGQECNVCKQVLIGIVFYKNTCANCKALKDTKPAV